jgi:hypothetical protein
MTTINPDGAVRVAILADLCDAADPSFDWESRFLALENATETDLAFTAKAGAAMLHWLLGNYRQRFGSDAAAEVMRQMRVACGRMFTDEAS